MKPYILGHLANSKEWPVMKRASFLEPGIVSYKDIKNADGTDGGVWLVRKEVIDAMLNSFPGKPVTIGHPKNDAQPENFEAEAKGAVATTEPMAEDGKYYVSLMAWDDKARALCSKGVGVSCGLKPLRVGPGGEWHNVKYDYEVLEGELTHLALLDGEDPRYENMKVLINSKGINSKEGTGMKYKIFGKASEKDKTLFNADSSSLEIDGEQVSIADLAATWDAEQAEKEKLAKDQAGYVDEGAEIKFNGKSYKFGDLAAAHKAKKTKMNAEAEDKAKKDKEEADKKEKEGKEKQNAMTEEEKAAEAKKTEDLKNAKIAEEKAAAEAADKAQGANDFKLLNAIADKSDDVDPTYVPNTMQSRVQRAKDFFKKVRELKNGKAKQ